MDLGEEPRPLFRTLFQGISGSISGSEPPVAGLPLKTAGHEAHRGARAPGQSNLGVRKILYPSGRRNATTAACDGRHTLDGRGEGDFAVLMAPRFGRLGASIAEISLLLNLALATEGLDTKSGHESEPYCDEEVCCPEGLVAREVYIGAAHPLAVREIVPKPDRHLPTQDSRVTNSTLVGSCLQSWPQRGWSERPPRP